VSESAAGARGEGEGEGDGKVYLGSSGLQMKVGVTGTLPSGTAPVRRHNWKPKPSADRLTPKPQLSPADVATPPVGTPAPRLTSQADLTPAPRLPSQADLTPPPRVRGTPRPAASLFGASRQPTMPPPAEATVQGVHLAKGTLTGLCLMMFSFGVITTVLVDRYWPTRKADWAGSVSAPAQAPAVVGQAILPAPAASTAATKTDSPTSPSPSPSVEPIPVDPPGPLEAKAAPAAGTAPAATLEPSRAPVTRPAPAQGRGPGSKRPGTGRPAGSPPGGDRTMAPTGTWVDPFE
jgi:hypothetical protein